MEGKHTSARIVVTQLPHLDINPNHPTAKVATVASSPIKYADIITLLAHPTALLTFSTLSGNWICSTPALVDTFRIWTMSKK